MKIQWFTLYSLFCCAFGSAGAFGQSASQVVSWGYNDWSYHAEQVPQGLTNVVAISAADEDALALNADGTVVDFEYQTPQGLSNVVAIAAGNGGGFALKNNGTVVKLPGGTVVVSNVVAISATQGLLSDGTVYPWVNSSFFPPGLSNVVGFASGYGYPQYMVLQGNGTVVAWGTTTNIQATPVDWTNIAAVALGDANTLSLKADGTVALWSELQEIPAALTNVAAVAASTINSPDGQFLILKNDATLFAWGDNTFGETNIPAGLTNVMAIAAGYGFNLALERSGFPVAFGLVSARAYSGAPVTLTATAVGTPPLSYQWQFNGSNIPGATMPWLSLTNVQLTNAGTYSIVVSNPLGSVTNSTGILTVDNSPPIILAQPQSQVVPLGDNPYFSVVVTGSQPLSYQWQFNGADIVGATNAVLALGDVQWADAGNYSVQVSNAFGSTASSNAALTFVRTSVVAWGDNFFGQCDVPSGLSNVVAVSAGFAYSLALNANGTVMAWGDNEYGQCDIPQNATNIVGIAAGCFHALGLVANGSIIGWGDNSDGEINVPAGLTNVVAISAGDDFSMALQGNGTVSAWGINDYGQTNVPSGLTNVVAIAAGYDFGLALNANGSIIPWGSRNYAETNIPPGLTDAIGISAGCIAGGGMVVRADGVPAGWGEYGSDAPANLTNVVADCLGEILGMALNADHTVAVWGDNHYGECNIPPGLTNVIAISGGQEFCLVLDPSGGAIIITVSSGGVGQVAYLTTQIGPPEALAAGAAWEATGMSNWSSASNYVAAFTAGQSATVLFQSIPGWNTPASQRLNLTPGNLTVATATYTPVQPIMSAIPGTGFGLTGTTNTSYRIQYSTNLVKGPWLTLSTNRLGQGFNKVAPWPPATHTPATFYRAVWLP